MIIWIYLGILLGVLFRALLPFFSKLIHAIEEGGTLEWEPRYTWICGLNLVIGLGGFFVACTSFNIPDISLVDVPLINNLIFFSVGFVYGQNQAEVLTRLAEYAGLT